MGCELHESREILFQSIVDVLVLVGGDLKVLFKLIRSIRTVNCVKKVE